MSRRYSIYALILLPLLALLCASCEEKEPPSGDTDKLAAACHYISGGGVAATGGSGGTFIWVETLEDTFDSQTGKASEGTLRYAIEQGGTRIIGFRVAGTIHLQRALTISNGNLTILGQSAPGDGICIADYPLIIKANNVIVRFLRFRMGEAGSVADKKEYDAVSVNNTDRVVLDHLSCSWSVDECVSCYGNTNFTMQYCFISESLRNSVHGKGRHGYAGIWGGKNASFHHNLLAHHDSRNPRFDHDYVEHTCHGPLDFVNNVVYNWGGNSAYGGESSSTNGEPRHINFVANYYKPGPATSDKVNTRLLNPTTKCDNVNNEGKHEGCLPKFGGTILPAKFYLSGNYMYGSADVTSDNWSGVYPDESEKKSQCVAASRWTDGLTALTTEQTSEQAFETVLTKGGCSYVRDAIDRRLVTEVRNGTATCKGSNGSSNGLIDTPSDAGGWPTYQSAAMPQDTDNDGIPDEWEAANGLNPNWSTDARKQTLVEGFTNMEVYMNSIVADLY